MAKKVVIPDNLNPSDFILSGGLINVGWNNAYNYLPTSDLLELNTATDQTGRFQSAEVLNQWLNGKGYSTQTLTQGANISIIGGVISAIDTTYGVGSIADLDAGIDVVGKLYTAKDLNDWITSLGYLTPSNITGKADKTTKMIAAVGLLGGGTLAADRTFSVDFGTTTGTVAQGNDQRILDGATAFSWTDHAGKYALISHVGSRGVAQHLLATDSEAGFFDPLDKIKLDTVAENANYYIHPTGDGNLHVPANGTGNNNKFLQAGATAGSLSWHALVKADVGLGNADNTADNVKNVLSATKLTTAVNINGVSFDGTSNITVYDATKEPTFAKNTGFNKNFGTTAGTVSEGNHNHNAVYAPLTRTLTINGSTQSLAANRTWNVGTVTSIGLIVPTGFTKTAAITTSGDITIGFATDYSLLEAADKNKWNIAHGWGDHSGKYPLYNGTGATGTWGIGISGNAETVTNGLYSNGSYANPNWLTSLHWNKITDTPTTLSGYGITDAINTSKLGVANGVATLDGSGILTASQLPAGIGTIVEAANLASFPAVGAASTIYVALDTSKTYRWSGSTYVETSAGEVTSVNGEVGVVVLTKTHIGLGNVDNTADNVKNVLSATKLTTARNINGVAFNGTTDITVYDTTKEPTFSKNTGFNKNFGTTSGTVSEGNHNHDTVYAPLGRTITINGTAQSLAANRTWNVGTVTSVGLTMPVGMTASADITTSGKITIALATDYFLLETADKNKWNTAFGWGNHANNLYAPIAHVGTGGAAHANATGSVAGFMTAAHWTKLENIAPNANNYTHPTGDGNLHVPANGTGNNGRFLKASGTAGSISWALLTKADVGLGNVDNTADNVKNVLSATKLTTAVNINGVAFNGTANITVYDSTAAKLATTITINGTAQSLAANRTWNVGTVTSVGLIVPTGMTKTAAITTIGDITIGFDTGYSLLEVADKNKWNIAHGWGNHADAGYSTQTLTQGTNITINSGVISAVDTTYLTNSLAELNAGSDTIAKLQTAKNLKDWINTKAYLTTETDPTVPSHVKAITTGNLTLWSSALQSGDNISLLANNAGYITSASLPTNFVNTTGNQTAILGDKEWTGYHSFVTTKVSIDSTTVSATFDVNTNNSGLSSSSHYSQITLSDNGAVRAYIRNVRDGSGKITFAYNNHLAFVKNADGSEKARFNSSGELLLGKTTSNGYMLQVDSGTDTGNGLHVRGNVVVTGLATDSFVKTDGNGKLVTDNMSAYATQTWVSTNFAAVSHTHAQSDITGLTAALSGKEPTLSKADIVQGTGVTLTGTLANRIVGSGGNVTIALNTAYTDDLYLSTTALSGYATQVWVGNNFAAISHTHAQSDITGLVTALSNKEATFSKNTGFNKNFGTAAGTVSEGNHGHTTAQITALTGYVIGSNTAIGAVDTLNVALGKIQAQINSKTGTVTSVATGTGLTGGAITTTGTVALNSTSILSLTKADSALQSGANISLLTNNAGYITSASLPTNFVNTTGSQTGILGAKSWSNTNYFINGIGISTGTVESGIVLQIGTSSTSRMMFTPWLQEFATTGGTGISSNIYYSGGYKYRNSASGVHLDISLGIFNFFTAPSGSAGDAATLTSRFKIQNNGVLLAGTNEIWHAGNHIHRTDLQNDGRYVQLGANISLLTNNAGYITAASLPTNYITTNTNQTTGLTGNKTWSGTHTFSTRIELTNGLNSTSDYVLMHNGSEKLTISSDANTTYLYGVTTIALRPKGSGNGVGQLFITQSNISWNGYDVWHAGNHAHRTDGDNDARYLQSTLVKQVTGTSTTDLMSQKAITDTFATKEPTFSKNTGFNKNFGTTAGTVSEGNHNHDTVYAPLTRTITINGTTQSLAANRTWSVGTVTSVAITPPTGFKAVSSPSSEIVNIALNFNTGYSLPTNAKQSDWDAKLGVGANNSLLTNNSGYITSASLPTNFVNTTGNQTAILGDKEWTGYHSFVTTKVSIGSTSIASSLDVTINNSGVSSSHYSQITLSDNGAVRAYIRNVRDSTGKTLFAYNDHLSFSRNSDGVEMARFNNTGELLIGKTSSNGYKLQIDSGTDTGSGLYVRGAGYFTGDVTSLSDQRMKSDITLLSDNLKKLYGIGEYAYILDGKPTYGFLAQEVQKIMPNAVMEMGGVLGLKYNNLIPLVSGAIKEVDSKVERLEKRVAFLEAKLRESGSTIN